MNPEGVMTDVDAWMMAVAGLLVVTVMLVDTTISLYRWLRARR